MNHLDFGISITPELVSRISTALLQHSCMADPEKRQWIIAALPQVWGQRAKESNDPRLRVEGLVRAGLELTDPTMFLCLPRRIAHYDLGTRGWHRLRAELLAAIGESSLALDGVTSNGIIDLSDGVEAERAADNPVVQTLAGILPIRPRPQCPPENVFEAAWVIAHLAEQDARTALNRFLGALRGRLPERGAEVDAAIAPWPHADLTMALLGPGRESAPSPNESRPPPQTAEESTSAAVAIWRERLEFLHAEEAKVASAAERFAIKKQIEEARAKLKELSDALSAALGPETEPLSSQNETQAPEPGAARPRQPSLPLAEVGAPEVYVSYAWANQDHVRLVDELCAALAAQGLYVHRDSNDLQAGERISEYMERLSEGRCVLVVLSEAYLHSENCMTELYRIYLNARQRGDDFLRRIVPLVQEDANIGKLAECVQHALYWKGEYDALDTVIRAHGSALLGQEGQRRFMLIGEFHRQVIDMLTYVNDKLVPRDRPTLSDGGFAVVRALIAQALA